jgi:PAS domain S-box-containing protein
MQLGDKLPDSAAITNSNSGRQASDRPSLPPQVGQELKDFQILLVEDTLTQTALVKRMLRNNDRANFVVTVAHSLKEAIDLPDKAKFDVILLDLGLPDSAGVNTLVSMYEVCGPVPIVVFTSDSEETLGMELIKRGAQDYVEKRSVNSEALVRAITYAAERRKLSDKFAETQRIFVAFIENNPAATFVLTEKGDKLYANEQFERSFYHGRAGDAAPADLFIRRTRHEDLHILRGGAPIESIENIPGIDGLVKNWLVVKFPFHDMSGRRLIGGTAIDVTELERSREAVRQAREMFNVLFYHSNVPQAIVAPDFALRRVNQAYCDMLGYTEDELVNRKLQDLTLAEDWHSARNLMLIPSNLHRSTSRMLHKSGKHVVVERVATVITGQQDLPLFATIIDHAAAVDEGLPCSSDTSGDCADILKLCPLPAFVLDDNEQIIAANKHFANCLGLDDSMLAQARLANAIEVIERWAAAPGYNDSEECWSIRYTNAAGEKERRRWKVSVWHIPAAIDAKKRKCIIVLAN